MAVPQNKEELLLAIKSNYLKFQQELSTIPHDLWTEKQLEGHAKGTYMNIHDLVAYLTGWGELVLKWIEKKDNNEPVDFPESGYKWNELGKLAQKFYQDYDKLTCNNLIKKLDNTVTRILTCIENKTNVQLYEEPWYEKWTLGRMIQFNTASPYTNARGRIRKWKKEL